MQVNPEDGPPEIYVTWSDPRMTDFENDKPVRLENTQIGSHFCPFGPMNFSDTKMEYHLLPFIHI